MLPPLQESTIWTHYSPVLYSFISYRRAPFFEGYKFCIFHGFFGLTWNLFHQKLAKTLLWHGLQTEEKEKITIFLTCRYYAWRFPNTYSHIATTQSWSTDKWLTHKMTWLHAYLNYSWLGNEFSVSSSYLSVHHLQINMYIL